VITADTITDEQIRELMVEPPTERQHWWPLAALGDAGALWTLKTSQYAAREYCAEILNARKAQP
jgi:hypothetical protein